MILMVDNNVLSKLNNNNNNNKSTEDKNTPIHLHCNYEKSSLAMFLRSNLIDLMHSNDKHCLQANILYLRFTNV